MWKGNEDKYFYYLPTWNSMWKGNENKYSYYLPTWNCMWKGNENICYLSLYSYKWDEDIEIPEIFIMARKPNARTKIMKTNTKTKNLRLQRKRMENVRSKLHLLKHISKRNCALLPYLDDESLHTLGEFIYNIIHQKVKLDSLQEKKSESYLTER